jgi:ABC-type antimicrobial peptide transport system permease subunit
VQIANFYRDSLARMRTIPGVRSAAWVGGAIPLVRNPAYVDVIIEGRPRPTSDEDNAWFAKVTPDLFSALDIPLLAGRRFSDLDRLGSKPVVIVDDSFARMYFHGHAVGHWIAPDFGGSTPAHMQIVGVVASVRNTYATPISATIYLPLAQNPIAIRTSLVFRVQPGVDVDDRIAAAITSVDPLIAAPAIRSMQSMADATLAQARLSAILFGVLSFVALFLAVAGVYAVVAFGVAQRTQEFGIRMALGAQGESIVANVVARAARLAVIGVLGGIVVAGFAAGLVENQLVGIGRLDPITYAVVVIVVLAAALLASVIPALRATRVDPVVALRHL